jgi:LysR family tcuABC transcriptional regulator
MGDPPAWDHMELRQLRYFLRVVELGSMGRAAADLGVVTSTLSQQISRLEGELATRLLQRTSTGVVATDSGLAFLRQAQLALRHVDGAARAARQGRLSGDVSVGLAATTAAVLALPFIEAMRERYPNVRLHLVEGLSGYLGSLLNLRQLDLAVLFQADLARRWSVVPLLDERLFLVGRHDLPGMPVAEQVRLAQLGALPLVLPSLTHTLRSLVQEAFARVKREPNVVMEVDGLGMLLDAVRAGQGATIQPGAALARARGEPLVQIPIRDRQLSRPSLLVSVSDDELSPVGLAARVVLADVARRLVREGRWAGASLRTA